MEVHREMGHGFLEPVYQQALSVELTGRSIPFCRERLFDVSYKGVVLESQYRPDFVCFDSIILELKALGGLDTAHEAQVLNYLKATGMERGLLVNFGTHKLQFKRLIFSQGHLRSSVSSADGS